MAHQKKKSGLGKTLLISGCVVIFATAALVVYMVNAPDAKPVAPVASAAVTRNDNGIVLVPDGQGNCHKYVYANNSGKANYEGTTACDNTRPKDGSRANLPPALRGMQENLKR